MSGRYGKRQRRIDRQRRDGIHKNHAIPPHGEVRPIKCPECKGFGRWYCAHGRRKKSILAFAKNIETVVEDFALTSCPIFTARSRTIITRPVEPNHRDTRATHMHICLPCNGCGWMTGGAYAAWMLDGMTR